MHPQHTAWLQDDREAGPLHLRAFAYGMWSRNLGTRAHVRSAAKCRSVVLCSL